MKPLEPINQEDVRLILRIIDKLLSTPLNDQIYRKELTTLFRQLELISNPIFYTSDANFVHPTT